MAMASFGRLFTAAANDFSFAHEDNINISTFTGDLCGLTALLYVLHKPLTKGKGHSGMSSSRGAALQHLFQYKPVSVFLFELC